MSTLERQADDQEIDQLLADAEVGDVAPGETGSTVNKLRGELETIASVLRKPAPQEPFEAEPECARAVELASSVASGSGPDSVKVRVGGEIAPTAELGQIGAYKLLELLGQGGMGRFTRRCIHGSKRSWR